MPSPTKFTLTPTRKAKMREMFENQHSLQSVAIQHGISYKHLSKILRKAKFDYKAIQMSGINNLRADVLKSIGKIDDPKDKATVGLKYLDKYDKDKDYVELALKIVDKYDKSEGDNEATVTSIGSDKKLNIEIQAKILNELADD